MKLDLNCDLGESEPAARTRALMRWITSANIACGGHAGDERTMERCVALAKANGVRVGAHPGPRSRETAGRGAVEITPRDLEALLIEQVGALDAIACGCDAKLHHIKLHGALYHAVESSDALAAAYAECVTNRWPGLVIYAFAGGKVVQAARSLGCLVWEEAFADRGYRDDGTLVPRGEPGALISDPAAAVERVTRLGRDEGITTASAALLPLRADTVCVHGDTPGAVTMARAIRAVL